MGKLYAIQATKTQKCTYWNKQVEAGGPHLECPCNDTIIAHSWEWNREHYTERPMY